MFNGTCTFICLQFTQTSRIQILQGPSETLTLYSAQKAYKVVTRGKLMALKAEKIQERRKLNNDVQTNRTKGVKEAFRLSKNHFETFFELVFLMYRRH